MKLKNRIISGAIWNTLNSGATFFISIGTIAVLARLLTPQDFGLFAMISVAISILDSVADMGISAAVISYRDIKDRELNSLFYFNIIVGILLTILLILASPIVVYYYKETKIYLYLWILSTNFAITSPAVLFNVLMKKHMKFKLLSKINIVSAVVYAVVVIGYAFFSRDVMSFVVGMLAQSLVSTILVIHFGLMFWKPGKFTIKYSDIKRFLSFGLYQMGERVINRINKNIDYLLIGRFLGAEALGYYSLAYNLMIKPVQKINPIVTTVAFPALAEIQNDIPRLRLYYLKMIRYISYIQVPIYLLIFVLAENIILFLYGDKWYPAVPVLAIFSFLGILYAVGNPLGSLLLARGRADIGFWFNFGLTLFLLAANYIGMRWGVTGVALSTFFTVGIIFIPAGWFICYYLARIRAIDFLAQMAKPVLFAFLSAEVIIVMQRYLHYFPLAHVQQLILYGGVFAILYIFLMALFDKPELVFLRQTLVGHFRSKPE